MSIKSGSLKMQQKEIQEVSVFYGLGDEDTHSINGSTVDELKKELVGMQLELKIKNDQIRNTAYQHTELVATNSQLFSKLKEQKQLLFYKQQQIQTYESQQQSYKTSVASMERCLQQLCEDITKQETKKKIFSDLNLLKSGLIELREALNKAEVANHITSSETLNLLGINSTSNQKSQQNLNYQPESSALQSPPRNSNPHSTTIMPQSKTSLSLIPEIINNNNNGGVQEPQLIQSLQAQQAGRKYFPIHQQNASVRFEIEVTQGASQAQIPHSFGNFESVDNLEERKENSAHGSPSTNDGQLEFTAKQPMNKIAKTLSEGDPDYEKNYSLLKWLGDASAEFSKIKMVYYNNYRGVHARCKIMKGETILFIPSTQMITLEVSKQAPLCIQIEKLKLPLISPKHTFLAIYILREKKNPKSIWKPFLDVLPMEYTTFPILYTEDELQWLKGSPFNSQIRERRQCIASDYNTVAAKIPEFTKFCTLDEFAWARMMAASRIYGLFVNKVRTDAFVPLADMFNHRRPAFSNWGYCQEKNGFVMKASEDIKRGDQIYYSCGRKCNSRFLLNYGFVAMNNEANEIALRVDFEKRDALLNMKLKMIGKRRDEQFIYHLQINYEEKSVLELFGFLRFVLISDLAILKRFEQLCEQGKAFEPNKTPPFSVENEKKMWAEILKICTDIAVQYPTTLAQDRVILETNKLSINQKNCVILRMGEKEILDYYVTMANNMIALFSMTKTEVKKYILNNQELTRYSSYVNGIVLPLLSKGNMDEEEYQQQMEFN